MIGHLFILADADDALNWQVPAVFGKFLTCGVLGDPYCARLPNREGKTLVMSLTLIHAPKGEIGMTGAEATRLRSSSVWALP